MDVKKISELFSKELVVINMGLESFADNFAQRRREGPSDGLEASCRRQQEVGRPA